MEMIDVLQKLREIAETKPELVADAVDNVQRTNPTEAMNPKQQAAIAISKKEKMAEGGMKDYLHDEAEKMSRKEFIEKHGESLAGFWDSINGTEESAVGEDTRTARRYTDDQINSLKQWAKKYSQYKNLEDINLIEALYEYVFDLGITQLTFEVGELKAAERKIGKKQEDWEDAEINAAMEMSPISNGLMDELHRIIPGDKVEIEKKLNTIKTMLQKAGLKEDAGEGKEEKKEVKESIQISADSPQEASMMMQLLKLAGVQPVDQAMISQEPEAGENPAHGEPGHSCGHDGDDAMGSQDMGRMRDMMSAPAEEKAEETFANSMGDEKEEPKYQDTDTLVNTMSGGLNRKKQAFVKAQDGDNAMAVEDTVTEEDLANSLRSQYEGFKEAYHKKAKMDEAPKPDFLDMDKDGNKKEPMKKAIKDKEAK